MNANANANPMEKNDAGLLLYDWIKAPLHPIEWNECSRCEHCAKPAKARFVIHNCRLCGKAICSMCSGKFLIPSQFCKKGKKGPVRVCWGCRDDVLQVRSEQTGEQVSVRPHRHMFSTDTGEVHIHPPKWVDRLAYARCWQCFRDGKKLHHCRVCGEMFCSSCSVKEEVPKEYRYKKKKNPVRVCFECRYLISRAFLQTSPAPTSFKTSFTPIGTLRGKRSQSVGADMSPEMADFERNRTPPRRATVQLLHQQHGHEDADGDGHVSSSSSSGTDTDTDQEDDEDGPTTDRSIMAGAAPLTPSRERDDGTAVVSTDDEYEIIGSMRIHKKPVRTQQQHDVDDEDGNDSDCSVVYTHGGVEDIPEFEFLKQKELETLEKTKPGHRSLNSIFCDGSGGDSSDAVDFNSSSSSLGTVPTKPLSDASPSTTTTTTITSGGDYEAREIDKFCSERRDLGLHAEKMEGGERFRTRRYEVFKGYLRWYKPAIVGSGEALKGCVYLEDAQVNPPPFHSNKNKEHQWIIHVALLKPEVRHLIVSMRKAEDFHDWKSSVQNHSRFCKLFPQKVAPAEGHA